MAPGPALGAAEAPISAPIKVSVDPAGATSGGQHCCGNSRAARLALAAVATAAAAAAAAAAAGKAAVAAMEAVTAGAWTAFEVTTAKVLADCADGSTAAGVVALPPATVAAAAAAKALAMAASFRGEMRLRGAEMGGPTPRWWPRMAARAASTAAEAAEMEAAAPGPPGAGAAPGAAPGAALHADDAGGGTSIATEVWLLEAAPRSGRGKGSMGGSMLPPRLLQTRGASRLPTAARFGNGAPRAVPADERLRPGGRPGMQKPLPGMLP